MTVYLADLSNYDWTRDPDDTIDFSMIRADGIAGITHKATEGHTYADAYFAKAIAAARPVGFALLGSYHVLWPDDPLQTGHWFQVVDNAAPWWREHPCFVWQIDAERFDYMPRQPNLAEIHDCGARLEQLGVDPNKIVVYAPKWVYGDTLTGLRYKLWSSAYGANPAKDFIDAYPGDTGAGWAPYSGVVPTIWQFGSQTWIGNQATCDANAVRVSSEAELQALFSTGGDDMSQADVDAIKAHIDKQLRTVVLGDDPDPITGDTHPNNLERIRKDQLAFRGKVEALVTDLAAQVAAVQATVAELGAGGTVDYGRIQEATAEAVRTVLGSLNDLPSTG